MSAERSQYPQACALLYDRPPQLDATRVTSALAPTAVLGCRTNFEGQHHPGSPVVKGRVDLDRHHIELISVAAPADDLASTLALQQSLLPAVDYQALRGHRSYIHCRYAGGSSEPLEQLRALYRVVGALIDSCAPAHMLGLLNVPTLQAFTRADLLGMLRWLDSDPPPVGLWVRVVALSGDRSGVWLVTRGLFAFLQPEIAVAGTHVADEEGAESLLMSIASWLIQGGTRMHPGDSLEMLAEEGRESRTSRWQCRVPTGDQQYLAAPCGTLILEPA